MKPIPTLKKSQFESELAAKRWLYAVSFEITSTCNMQCVHCYLGKKTCKAPSIKKELTTDEIKKILDDLSDHGCFFLLITGGEPLLRKDFFDIYDYAYNKGFLITLFTNATLINKNVINFLEERPPNLIEPTIYGMTKKTYESITKVSGSYDRAWNGIRLLMKSSLPLGLKTVILQQNKHELFSFKEFCQKNGIIYRATDLISDSFDKANIPDQYRLSPEEGAKIICDFVDNKHELLDNRFSIRQCNAGTINAYINSSGYISCCTLLSTIDKFTTDLRKNTLDDAWKKMNIRPKFPHAKKCDSCKALNSCYQCPALAYHANGNMKTINEWVCTYMCSVYKNIYGKDPLKNA